MNPVSSEAIKVKRDEVKEAHKKVQRSLEEIRKAYERYSQALDNMILANKQVIEIYKKF